MARGRKNWRKKNFDGSRGKARNKGKTRKKRDTAIRPRGMGACCTGKPG